ncbi:hypothetical protein [Spirochaeta isovalerica]|uniref:Cobalt transport protein n=1 Tax=Spirochaeta isovalerica TaxID=150 RepID=A0A841RB65_9SPIO|nr:hypothetical protein [Spirochaeta isovalerica]MBB6479662.1 hypothetical protein [Spirochaeta isovalerica]
MNKPKFFLWAGMAAAPAFLFQSDPLFRWIQVFLFISASIISGKKFRLLPNLLMSAGIIFANLITPNGKVLLSISGLSVTQGALINGISRAGLLIGMIYLSRFSVRKNLQIPGRTGSLLSLVFFYFDRIIEGERVTRGNFIEKIDEKLMAVQNISVENLSLETDSAKVSPGTKLIVPTLVFILSWTLFVIPFVV